MCSLTSLGSLVDLLEQAWENSRKGELTGVENSSAVWIFHLHELLALITKSLATLRVPVPGLVCP